MERWMSTDAVSGAGTNSLRQKLWRERGKALPNLRTLEDKPELLSDLCRRIDTAVMVADCLTKSMKEDFVVEKNEWCYRQGDETKAVKLRKQLQRRKTSLG